jgi:hypothetical protein
MIEVDVRSLIPEDIRPHISPAVMHVVLVNVAEAARAKWIQLSLDQLRTSQQSYTAGISTVKQSHGIAWIELNGDFPNMIEQGFGPFDLRNTLLDPSKRGVKTGADGERYRSIMFRRGTGGATGRNFAVATDLYAATLGERRARAIGRAAMKAGRDLKKGQHSGEGVGATKRQDGAHPLRVGEFTPAGHQIKHAHKTDLFAGMQRFEQVTKRGGIQHTFGVFRTISTGVPEGWIHPGYQPGANLSAQVERYMSKVGPSMFLAALEG